VNGHSLKLHFYMFERSQRKHNSLNCYKVFLNIFHYLQILHAQNLTQIFFKLHVQSTQTLRVESLNFFQTFFLKFKCAPFLLNIGNDFKIDD